MITLCHILITFVVLFWNKKLFFVLNLMSRIFVFYDHLCWGPPCLPSPLLLEFQCTHTKISWGALEERADCLSVLTHTHTNVHMHRREKEGTWRWWVCWWHWLWWWFHRYILISTLSCIHAWNMYSFLYVNQNG